MEETYRAHGQDDVRNETFAITLEKDAWAKVHQLVQQQQSSGWAFYFVSQTSEGITIHFQRPLNG